MCQTLVTAGEEILPEALNDVVVSAGEPSEVLYAEICKEDKPILNCQADGLIVATRRAPQATTFQQADQSWIGK